MEMKLKAYLELIRWNKPAGWLLLLWPTLSALWMAANGAPGAYLASLFIIGTILMRSAGCAINDVFDQDIDRHVKRTAHRPLTSGKISTRSALIVALSLSLIAWSLTWTVHPYFAWASLCAGLLAYLYPLAKRYIAMPQAVLGLTFGMGIPLAYLAVYLHHQNQDSIAISQWLLHFPSQAAIFMLANFFWVLAYDTEYAMADREDDRRLSIYTSAITLGVYDVPAIMGFYLAAFCLWIISTPLIEARAGQIALGLIAIQIAGHYYLIRRRQAGRCLRAFQINHWIGCTLFIGIALSI